MKSTEDMGVPMQPAPEPETAPRATDPYHSSGPEDALGTEPTRGDYTGRTGGSDYLPHTTVVIDGKIVTVAQKPSKPAKEEKS